MSVTIAKVGVESSSLFSRSKFKKALIERWGLFLWLNIFSIFKLAYLMQVYSFLAEYNLPEFCLSERL